MPNRGRRVAARQSQITSKRKRNRSVTPTSTERSQESANLSMTETSPAIKLSSSIQHNPLDLVTGKVEYSNYARSEVRRILIIGSIITAILIILSVVLE